MLRQLLAASLLSALALCSFASTAALPKSGTYKTLSAAPIKALQARKTGDVKVVEFFSLACPHCADFDPMVEKWLKTKPANVEFERIPVGFGRDSWQVLAKAYYVAVALGDSKTLVPDMFHAIHKQNLPLYQVNTLAQFFAAHGTPAATFEQYYHSYSINQQAKEGDALITQAGVMLVPTLVVNGEYETNPTLAGNFKTMMSTMKALIVRVQSRGKTA